MTARRRPFAFAESWPFVLLMLATGIALSSCEYDDQPTAAPACTVPCGGLHGPSAAATTPATTLIAENAP